MRPRTVLNKLKWHPDFHFDEYFVVYLHRGAPNNEKTISCKKIISLQHSDFILPEDTHIPYHRILKILDKNGQVFWKKP
jgi:uncharacterized protein (UPF0248 family)